MAKRDREDFLWVRPLEGLGSVRIPLFKIDCTREQPQEILKLDWEHFLRARGVLELCPSPKTSREFPLPLGKAETQKKEK